MGIYNFFIRLSFVGRRERACKQAENPAGLTDSQSHSARRNGTRVSPPYRERHVSWKSQMSNFRKQIRAIRLDNWFSLCPTGPPIRGAHNQRQISHMGFGKSGKKRKENGGGGNWEGCFWESTPAILLCACAPLGISVPKLLASLFLFFYFLLFTFSEMPKCQKQIVSLT